MRNHGDIDFAALVETHYAALFRFALSLTHVESDACDLVQDTFSTWAAKGHQLQDRSKVKTWLFTTLHRRFLETQRRAHRFPHYELESMSEELPPIDAAFTNQLDGKALVALLARVEPSFQAPVALFYLEDYSYNEIAGILEIPLGTVKSRIARGVAELRRLLCEQGQPGVARRAMP